MNFEEVDADDEETKFLRLYIKSWPKEVISFSTLTSNELNLLKQAISISPTTSTSRWKNEMNTLNVEYSFYLKTVYPNLVLNLQNNVNISKVKIPSQAQVWGALQWALVAVRSRLWSDKLVPIGDFFNHRTGSSRYFIDAKDFTTTTTTTTQIQDNVSSTGIGMVIVASGDNFVENTELCDNYDYDSIESADTNTLLCNLDLFKSFGFTEDIPERACLELDIYKLNINLRASQYGIPSKNDLAKLQKKIIEISGLDSTKSDSSSDSNRVNYSLCEEWLINEAFFRALYFSQNVTENDVSTEALDAPMFRPFSAEIVSEKGRDVDSEKSTDRSTWKSRTYVLKSIEIIKKGVEETRLLSLQYVQSKKEELLERLKVAGFDSMDHLCYPYHHIEL